MVYLLLNHEHDDEWHARLQITERSLFILNLVAVRMPYYPAIAVLSYRPHREPPPLMPMWICGYMIAICGAAWLASTAVVGPE